MIKGNIILQDITINGNLVTYKFKTSGLAKKYIKADHMFCEYDFDLSDIPESILAIPFVGSFIGIAWIANLSLWVNSIDRTFYDALRNIKWAYAEMYPDCDIHGRFIPAYLTDNRLEKSDNALLLFGGGIDAHTTFLRHIDKINQIVNIQGWLDSPDAVDKAADADFAHCKEIAQLYDKIFRPVKSNFAHIVDYRAFDKDYAKQMHDALWHGIHHSMAFISIAILIAYSQNISSIFIGSSYTIGDNKSCASFPTTDNEFKFADNGKVTHDAFDLNRQQKTNIIVDHQLSTGKRHPLKVCSFNDRNCCECEKCLRSISAIVANGGNPRDFNFEIDGDLTNYFKDVMERKLALWGVQKEIHYWWSDTMKQMRANPNKCFDKKFAEWFTTYDFIGNKKRLLRKYYRQNFFSILKRKLHLTK